MGRVDVSLVAVLLGAGLVACSGVDDCGEAASSSARMVACSMPAEPTSGPSENGKPIRLATSDWTPGDFQMAALLRGRVEVAHRCVYIAGKDAARFNVTWPAGYSAEVESVHGVTVRDPDGLPVAYEGTLLSVGGGGLTPQTTPVCRVARGGRPFYITEELEPLRSVTGCLV